MRIFQSSLFRALCAIAVGVLILMQPDSTVQYLTIIIGIIFLVSGILSCVAYFYTISHWQDRQEVDAEGRVYQVRKPWFPVVGVGSILLGFILSLMPSLFVKSLVYVLAIVVILGALHQLFVLVGARRYYTLSGGFWVLPTLLLVAGIIMLVRPMAVAAAPLVVLAICLIVYGVSDAINSLAIHFKRKKSDAARLPMERGEYLEYEEVND